MRLTFSAYLFQWKRQTDQVVDNKKEAVRRLSIADSELSLLMIIIRLISNVKISDKLVTSANGKQTLAGHEYFLSYSRRTSRKTCGFNRKEPSDRVCVVYEELWSRNSPYHLFSFKRIQNILSFLYPCMLRYVCMYVYG